MTVKEIESAIARLSPSELAEFTAWFDRYHAKAWDHQIAEDVRAGRLNAAMRQAEEDFKAGRCKPL
jgi:hypothetical protein